MPPSISARGLTKSKPFHNKTVFHANRVVILRSADKIKRGELFLRFALKSGDRS